MKRECSINQHSRHLREKKVMGNAVTQPARTFEKKVLGVEDRNKSKVVKSGANNIHFSALDFQNHHPGHGGHVGTTSVGMGGGQVSVKAKWHG